MFDMTEKNKIQWIITPGLKPFVLEYLELLDLIYSKQDDQVDLRKKPLLICGDSGSGKSLFTYIFEHFYKKNINSRTNIVKLNISSLTESLIEAELFGHVKGSFTGADKDRDGYIKSANNGILVLEEIGEIPQHIQAKLLTFIEDEYFYPVGSEHEVKANTIIIATTNRKKEHFREDFWNRFTKYHVPTLYQRRLDILYYIVAIYPELIRQFTRLDMLAFLVYNWPGNIRELEQTILTYQWRKRVSQNPNITHNVIIGNNLPTYMFYFDSQYTSFNINKLISLGYELHNNGIDMKYVNRYLAKLHFSFDQTNSNPAIRKNTVPMFEKLTINKQETDIEIMNGISHIKEFKRSLIELGDLFSLPVMDNTEYGTYTKLPFFDFKPGELHSPRSQYQYHFSTHPDKNFSKHNKVKKQIIEYRLGGTLPLKWEQLPPFKNELIEAFYTHNSVNLNTATEDEILQHVYKSRINMYQGNKTKAAESLDIDRSRIYKQLKKVQQK